MKIILNEKEFRTLNKQYNSVGVCTDERFEPIKFAEAQNKIFSACKGKANISITKNDNEYTLEIKPVATFKIINKFTFILMDVIRFAMTYCKTCEEITEILSEEEKE